MDWISYIIELVRKNNFKQYTFFSPVSEESIAKLEYEFSITLPEDLAEFLQQSNGVKDEYGWWLIWSVEKMVIENNKYRAGIDYCLPFYGLFFFSDSPSNGDAYGYKILPVKGFQRIFRWDHEDDSRICYCEGLKIWLDWVFSGKA